MLVKRAFDRYSPIEIARMVFGWGARRLTNKKRKLPDFLIVGGQRCGTTSMYNYLIQHPDIEPAFIKETHFFDRNYHRGLGWYRSFFPVISESDAKITGEATPYYLYDPHVPKRVAAVVPSVKLIILLRNPTDRAYSHYQFEVRKGTEPFSFSEAINRELELFPSEERKVLEDESYYSDQFSRFSYLGRGLYHRQIENWRRYFPIGSFLFITSEEFYKETGSVMQAVFEFLGIPGLEIADRKTYNAADYEPMPDNLRSALNDYFEPHNQQLFTFLGQNLNWNNSGFQK